MSTTEWQRRLYRGNKVYARVDEKGDPCLDAGGLAAVRYKAEDDREYSVRPGDLEPITPESLARHRRERAGRRRKSSTIRVFTAGAAEPGAGPAGAGIVLEADGYRREISLYLGRASHDVAELVAVLEALRRIKDRRRKVRLEVESAHLEGVLSDAWKGEAHAALVERVRALARRFSGLSVHRARPRSRHTLHVLAEKLAGQARREQRSREELKTLDPADPPGEDDPVASE